MDLGYILGSIGIAFIISLILIGLVCLLYAYVTYKTLSNLGYANAFFAFIPYASWYALADVCCVGEDTIDVLGKPIDTKLFRFWWIAYTVICMIPVVGMLLGTTLFCVCLGTCFAKIYAMYEGVPEESTKTIGYLSGLIPIIPFVKFIKYSKTGPSGSDV